MLSAPLFRNFLRKSSPRVQSVQEDRVQPATSIEQLVECYLRPITLIRPEPFRRIQCDCDGSSYIPHGAMESSQIYRTAPYRYKKRCVISECMKSAFIRTVYFNGQYTNQYAQAKFTGHLIYRRFSVAGPECLPRFKEGLVISPSNEPDPVNNNDVELKTEEPAELEDTSPYVVEESHNGQNDLHHAQILDWHQQAIEVAARWDHDSSSAWGQGVLGLLRSIGV
ncbi:MAG: hypothetical protein Q9209_000264 [Squamulea sp. 1 TL-2023]